MGRQDRNMLLTYSTQIHRCVRRWFNRLIIDYIVILSLTEYYLVVVGANFDVAYIQSASFFSFLLTSSSFSNFEAYFDKIITESVDCILPHISIFCYWCEGRRRISEKWRSWLLELHLILFHIGAKNVHPIFCPRIYRAVGPENDVRHFYRLYRWSECCISCRMAPALTRHLLFFLWYQ